MKRLTAESVLLITGASSDIGLGIASYFAAQGVQVVAHYGSNAVSLRELGLDNIHLVQADLTDEKAVEALVAAIDQRYGRLDALVNTIGPFETKHFHELSPAAWKKSIDLNLNIAFTMSHYAAPLLCANKGQILSFTYAGAENITAWPDAVAYASAKAALAVLIKSQAQVFAPKGVRVNAIAPGWIDFGQFSEERRREISAQIPLGRLGRPEEVVALAAWILNESPDYMSGAMISLAGALEF